MSARKGKTAGTARQPHRKADASTAGAFGFGWLDAHVWVLLPVLLLIALAAYQPAWHGAMLWDDDFHITRPELRSLQGLRQIWFSIGATPQYYPVVHSAFWLQHTVWGDDTLGYHLVNITLHAVSAFLLALILRRLKARGAILAAVVFALHPVQVESVAWMTELKNTLSGTFYMAAAFAYLDFDASRRAPRYALALLLFALALLSKTVTATLPAALLVVFWWQRGRLEWQKDVLPLLPFFVVGIAGGLTTAWFERTLIGAEGAAFAFTFVERTLIAGRVIWFYLATLLWPAHLVFIYPRWDVSQQVWWQYLYPLGALVLTAALWRLRTWSRAPLAAFLFFVGTLFPALGFLNVYPFRFSFVADHFQYLAGIGIIALGASGLALLADRWQTDKRAAVGGAVVVAALLSVLTWNQSHLYADAETLYRETIARNPSCWMAHNNLGELKLQSTPDNLAEAMTHFADALRLYPTYPEAHNNMGIGLLRTGRIDEAIAQFAAAVRDKPTYLGAHANLALALAQGGRLPEAAAEYVTTLRLRPDSATAHTNLGVVLAQMGRLQDSLPHLREAVRLQPNDASGYYALGSVLQGLDQTDAAIAQYREALAHGPGAEAANIHNDLGLALGKLGRMDDAAAEFREALRLKPDFGDARGNLAKAIAGHGQAPAR